MRLLAKNPSQRPDSAADVLSALDAIDLTISTEQPATVDESHSLDSLAGGVFVGRQREMGELKACLEDALSGRGRLVTLVGEPGIGKTRTALELATYAGLRGAQVLWGRCYEGEGAPPYWPWVQAIRSYVRDVDPEQLRSDMGAGAPDIGQVVSEVRERLPGLESPPQLEPEQARFRLFDSITTFLKSAGRRQPLVLVLDDLHWADHPSLLLLEFLARELGNSRLLVIGTYRDVELSRHHPLSKSLGELTRERLFQRVLLRGLDQSDVGRFIELASGVTPPIGMVDAVHRQTEGNPLFVTEVVRLLVQEGELTQEKVGQRDSWSVRIPEGVREVIGRRLDRLSERCNETLTIASVVGREFTFEQLSPLIAGSSAGPGQAMTEARLLDVLDEALSARVIEELPRAVGRYQFTHALIQETLAGELSTSRKVRLHARIAEALELLYGAETEGHASELAFHFAEAQTVLGMEKLVHYSLLAGERALAAYAWEEAQAHFQRSLAAKGVPLDGPGPVEDGETAALLFGLGRVQAATLERHQLQEAISSLSRAFDHYVEVGDADHALAIAEYPITTLGGQRTGAFQLVARALALVSPDSQQAGRLLCVYGRAIGVEEGEYERAQEALGRALDSAHREGDTDLEMRTLINAAQINCFHLHYQEGIDKGLKAIELARRADDPYGEVAARFWVANALLFMGDPEGALLHTSPILALAERLRDRWWLSSALVLNGMVSYVNGDWQAARDFDDRGLAVSSIDARLLAHLVMLEYQAGNFSQGEALLERFLEAVGLTPPGPSVPYGQLAQVIPLVAHITGVADRFDDAQAAAETVLSSPSATPLVASTARTGLALIAVQRGDIAAAGEQYDALEFRRGSMLPMSLPAVDRVLGLLSVTLSRLDLAMAHFEDALAFCRRAGHRPELAWTCCDYADMLRERNAEGDRVRATSLLDESLAISSESGMRALMERVLFRREILRA